MKNVFLNAKNIIDSAITIPNAIFHSWGTIIPNDLWKFCYPEKLSSKTILIAAISHKSIFIMHHSKEIIDNINRCMGYVCVDKINLRQFHQPNQQTKEKPIFQLKWNQDTDQHSQIINKINQVDNADIQNALKDMYFSIINAQN